MTTIEELEAEIAETASLLETTRSRAATSPSADLTAASLEARLHELEGQLQREKERRGKEILELRFCGEIADMGSLPLELLGNISRDLAHALGHAARLIKFGTQGRKLLRSVANELDLRLEGIGGGSTRLYISGETAPDLFGNSLIESTLYDTFHFLQHSGEDELSESVSQIGGGAANSFRSFFQTVGDAGLSAEATWETPKQEEIGWSVSAEGARKLATSLARLVTESPEYLKLTGKVITISSKRPLEIRDLKGNEYPIRVPDVLAESVKNLTVDQWIAVGVEKRSVRNEATGKAKVTYILQSRPTVMEGP